MPILFGQKRYKRQKRYEKRQREKLKKQQERKPRKLNEWKKVKHLTNLPLVKLETVKYWRKWKGQKVYDERIVESNTHKRLRELSVNYFTKNGYKCVDTAITVKGCGAIADYYMIESGKFFFVECLRKPDEKIIRKKILLANYAPTWFIVPIPYGEYTAKLTKQPVLEIDLSRGLYEPEKVMTETESTTYRRVYVDGMSTSSLYRQ